MNGETDAEALIAVVPALGGSALDTLLEQAADGIRAALADLDSIKSFVLAHAPNDLHYDYPEVSETPLEERLFLEADSRLSPFLDHGPPSLGPLPLLSGMWDLVPGRCVAVAEVGGFISAGKGRE